MPGLSLMRETVKKANFILRLAGGILLFALAAVLKSRGSDTVAFLILLILTLSEAVLIFLSSRKLLDLRLLLSLSWLGGLSLCMLGLSRLQRVWDTPMWFITGGFYFLTVISFEAAPYVRQSFKERRKKKEKPEKTSAEASPSRVFLCIILLFIAAAGSFLIESVVFNFDYPVFSDKPHAYTAFHITGIHYFVVSTPFIHALSVYYFIKGKPDRNRVLIIGAVNAVSLIIAGLILSKLQLFFSLVMSFSVWFMLKKSWTKKQLFSVLGLGALAFAAIAYAMIFLRKYPEGYLQKIFEFKDPYTPISLQYPYMYVVNNFENLNLLTENLTAFTYGKRILYPFFCLSGLKFLPQAAAFMSVEMFITKEELTTLTMIYDVYGDFGAAGVYLFGIILGAVSYFIQERAESGKPGALLLFSQMVIYMSLSFFSPWFSNPTVLFYLVLNGAISLFVNGKILHKKTGYTKIGEIV